MEHIVRVVAGGKDICYMDEIHDLVKQSYSPIEETYTDVFGNFPVKNGFSDEWEQFIAELNDYAVEQLRQPDYQVGANGSEQQVKRSIMPLRISGTPYSRGHFQNRLPPEVQRFPRCAAGHSVGRAVIPSNLTPTSRKGCVSGRTCAAWNSGFSGLFVNRSHTMVRVLRSPEKPHSVSLSVAARCWQLSLKALFHLTALFEKTG